MGKKMCKVQNDRDTPFVRLFFKTTLSLTIMR